jgi:plasmid stability protein
MPSVQVKNVPPAVHAELRRRAATDGISLQEYVLRLLERETKRPPLNDVLGRISRGEGGRTGGRISFEEAAEAIRAERDARS